MKRTFIASVLASALLLTGGSLPSAAQDITTPFVSVVKGEKSYWSGYDPINADGSVNVVVEIPAGTTAKYETNKRNGMLELEQRTACRASSSTSATRATTARSRAPCC